MPGIERLIERPDMNGRIEWTLGRDQRRVGLHALHVRTVFTECRKKQAVSAAHVQDSIPASLWPKTIEFTQNDPLPGPPPPMSLIQISVASTVLGVHPLLTVPAYDSLDDIDGATTDLFVDAPDVLADDTEEEEKYA